MTLAPPHAPTSRAPGRSSSATVTAVLVIHDGARWLPDCLDALALQTRAPDRLVVVDTGSTDAGPAIVAGHEGIRRVVGDVRVLTAPREASFGAAVARAVAEVGDPHGDGRDDWLWLLHDDSAAAPFTLERLLDTARRSPSVGVAGPKLVDWDDPGRLLEVGLQITRSGRRTASPAPGEPDQGQHDHRSDVLGVSLLGMLIRREVFDVLHGFDPAFASFRDDLDLSWRAHLAGHRVIVVPAASMREASASARGVRSEHSSRAAARRLDRRHGRQVALARCAPAAAPFLALWVLLASLGSAAMLLVLKRPRRAWAELGDITALAAPWRPLAARWRARGTRRVRRRDLSGLFVSRRVALRHTLDTVRESVAFEPRPDAAPGEGTTVAEPVETGPVADEAQDLTVLPATWPQRVARHPGALAVLAACLVAVGAWRVLIHAGALRVDGAGVSGGELLPVMTDASGLWHAWLDGWHGAGAGNATEQAPWLVVLAAAAWLVGHLPATAAVASPASVALTWLLFAAMPLSAATAYLGSRVVTRARWPRAWAALAWATVATLTTALAQGRLGAVVAHILLPLVAAGIVRVATRSAGTSLTFATALGIAVIGAFSPVLLVVGTVVALVLLVVGPGARVRLSALALLVVPTALLGPWLLRLVQDPRLLLAGPGLLVRGAAAPRPWELALLHPGGAGSYPVLLAAPVVLAGVAGLLRRGPASRALTALGVVAVLGLALALAAGRVVIAHVPVGASGTSPATPWSGTGLDLLALSLLAAALLGLDGLSGRLAGLGFGWRQVVVTPVIAAAVLAVLGAGALAGWTGLGGVLSVQGPTMPAVATEQATSSLANRLLVLQPTRADVGYRLLGVEPGLPARDLPSAAGRPDPLLSGTVAAVLADTGPANANAPRRGLFDLGVGFVGVRGPSSSALVRHLDATAGLTRLGDARGLVLWRVLPLPAAAANTTVPPSRVRVVDAAGAPAQSVDVSGAHAALSSSIAAGGPGRTLVFAEAPGWAGHARVTFAGHVLRPLAGAPQPTYALPAGAGQVAVRLLPTHPWWRWGQLGLLALAVFLAVPFGNRRSRRSL